MQVIKFFLFLCFFQSLFSNHEAFDHHVIFTLQNKIKNKKIRKDYNQKIHHATYELKQACKKLYTKSDTNNYYQHRSDSVFFIHIDHNLSQWTLYKPTKIALEDFVALAKKIYKKYGLYVETTSDQIVQITKKDKSVHTKYLTLTEFETYKHMEEKDVQEQIACLKAEQCSQEIMYDLETLQTIQHLKDSFFWHLQIPTTGLMPAEKFDIDKQFKPLAWHFLLWDLAPKKGKGARVAIIDTGASAFKIKDEELSKAYKKNINITVPDTLQNYGYNLVSENGLDPIRQVAINFGHYCDHAKFDSNELIKKLPEWIIDFIKNKNDFQLKQYFIKHAEKKFLNGDGNSLNEKGEEVLKSLLYGKYGIVQSESKSFFHVVSLQDPYNQDVLLETLPAPKVIGSADPFSAGHGTFTQGVVNGKQFHEQGITGLAPEADVTMIKAFNDNGTTNKTTLNAALQRTLALKKTIVSMSLKITDEVDKVADAPLKELIDSIDYVIAASGNDGNTQELAFKEAYPAKFDSVAFDVGAFAYDDEEYTICPFTQKELTIGPKFVAPGSNIFSAGLTPDQTEDSMYVFMTGTSIAVPVITGFMALVLGEFQDIFTREQILKVIYKFSMKLNNDDIWQNYIKVGTPDMRSALLCLHVLHALQKSLKSHYNFEKIFDQLVHAIYLINYYTPSLYEKELGYSFTQNFAHFVQASRTKSVTQEFIISCKTIDECINFMQQIIMNVLETTKNRKKTSLTNQTISKQIEDQLRPLFINKKYRLFQDLPSTAQNRIKLALTPRGVCPVDQK